MTPQLFSRVGEALFGPEWMAPLAGAIEVAPRTIARWASGYSRIPPNVQFELQQLVRQRGALLASVLAELETSGSRAADPAAPSAHAPDRPPAKPRRPPA